MGSATEDAPAAPSRGRRRRALRFLVAYQELISTILMATAALVTAWCAFEATIWGGLQSVNFAKASAARTESSRNELLDSQLTAIDVSTFLAWLEAVVEENGGDLSGKGSYQPDESTHSGFLYHRLRPDFRPAVAAWLASRPLLDPGAPATPFVMPEYRRPRADVARTLMEEANREIKEGLEDNHHANSYMLVTVLASLVVFCAGVSAKLEKPSNRLGLMVLACLVFAGCVVALIHLPITYY